MKIFQVTIGAAATQFTTAITPFVCMLVQNNTGHSTRIGDGSVSATKGIAVSTTPQAIQGYPGNSGDASLFYAFGTQNDVLDVMII
jgi:hypothetical protein